MAGGTATGSAAALALASIRPTRHRVVSRPSRYPAAEPQGTPRPTPGSSARRQSDTRTFPCVSAPIAASTWLGWRVSETQALPEETENPARSSSVTSVSPSTYKQENVTMCGSRRHRVAVHDGVGHELRARGRGSGSSARAARRRPRPVRRHAVSAAAAASDRGHVRESRAPGCPPARRRAAARASGRPCGRPARRPRRAAPLVALAVSSDQPAGGGIRPADAAASTSQRYPAVLARAPATSPPAAAWRPRGWPVCRQASSVRSRCSAAVNSATSARPSGLDSGGHWTCRRLPR